MRKNSLNSWWQAIGVFFFCLLASAAQAVQLVASVDKDTLSIQETFTLTIAADSNAKGQPDVKTLTTDFEILSNNQSQFTSISNAGSEFKKVWQLTLAPKRVGTLLIPSFNVDGAISDAIQITVTKQSQNQTSGNDNVRVALEIDKSSLYVQEQLLVTLKLISQVNLSQAEAQQPDIKDAVVIPLSDKPKQYLSTINGKQHLILESKYAVFPQTSGQLTIPSLIYTVVPNIERDLWSDPFGRNRANILRLPTEEKSITVNPVPSNISANSWQPANSLELHETWSASLNNLKMGEPVTRTITITAEGLSGGQIAPLPTMNQEGLTFYPDQPQNSDAKTERGIQGTRIETMAIVPNRGGEFTLPEVRVEWWDSKSQQLQTATLPAKTLNVIGSSSPSTPTSSTTNQTESVDLTNNALPQSAAPSAPKWIWPLIILLIITSVGLGITVLRLRAQLKRDHENQEALHHYLREKESHIWDELKKAASAKDALGLRKALIHWAQFHWSNNSINTLDDIAKLSDKADLAVELKKLDAVLYSNRTQEDWQPSVLLQILNSCRKEKKTSVKAGDLKSLYAE